MSRFKNSDSPKNRDRVCQLRLTQRELERIQRCADEYQGGNVSAWLRRAGRFYKPNKQVD